MCLIYTENNYIETEWKGKYIEYDNNFTENTVISLLNTRESKNKEIRNI